MNRKAHVVGAGIGGLATATALAARGWNVTVHERSSELREVGAGIYLKENALRRLDEVGVTDALLPKGSHILTSEIRDVSGHKLLARELGDERVFTVKRVDLHDALAQAAVRHGVTIELGSEIKAVSASGQLEANGLSNRTDLIVGADGYRSLTRRSVGLEIACVTMSNGSTRMLIPRQEEDSASGSVEYWGDAKRMMIVPCGADTYICASACERDARAVSLPFDVTHWTESFPELGSLLGRVDPHSAIHHPHAYVRVSSWSRGVVALVGDAVHGQPPNLGQGAGMAISNGFALAESLEGGDISTGLASWEKINRPITEAIQSWSYRWDRVVHDWPRGFAPVRSATVWFLGHFPSTKRRWGQLYRGQ